MTKAIVYINDQFIKPTSQLLASLTPGHCKLHGVFETMKVEQGRILLLKEHVDRALKGLKVLKITGVPSAAQIFRLLRAVQRRNTFACARLRLLIWQEGKGTQVAVVLLPYKENLKKIFRVTLIKTRRPASARLAHVKSLNYGLFAKGYETAVQKGFDEALLVNNRGEIFEASRANVFWVKAGKLYTPPLSSGCLSGIMRQQVMDCARQSGIAVQEKNLSGSKLRKADLVFLTNSLMGIRPCLVL